MKNKKQGWIAVDLDGTIAKYDGWRGETHIGEPIPKMVERVKNWLANGFEVKIFTARCAEADNNSDGSHHDVEAVCRTIGDWCEEHIGQRLEVTNKKDFQMRELWDDRAVQVIPNTGIRADGK